MGKYEKALKVFSLVSTQDEPKILIMKAKCLKQLQKYEEYIKTMKLIKN